MYLLATFLIFCIFLTSGEILHSRHGQRSGRSSATTGSPNSRQLTQIENADLGHRITRLEVLLVEKLENLRGEVRESSRRLQALEWQSNEVHSALEGFRADLNRLTQQIHSGAQKERGNGALQQGVDNLTKKVQLLIVVTKTLTHDIDDLKKNVTSVANHTKSLSKSTSSLVTKQFFNNALFELKHHQLYRPESSLYCPTVHRPPDKSQIPHNCEQVKELGDTRSGIYHIRPDHSSKPFMAVCDLQTLGGGWTVIQNRFDGSQDFYQNWHDYKFGFGNLNGEFWIGLEKIHQLTGYEVNELLIELQDGERQNKTAYYAEFSVGSEVEGYALKVLGGYSGSAGDSLLYHAGSRFSTKDMDQDGWPEGNCAQSHGGAWWYRSCDMSNLNGRYLSGELPERYIYQGMYWGEFRGAQYSLSRSRMLVRPRKKITLSDIDEIFLKKNEESGDYDLE